MGDRSKDEEATPAGSEEPWREERPRSKNQLEGPAAAWLGQRFPVGTRLYCRVGRVLPVGVEAFPISASDVQAFVHRQEWTWLRRVLDLSDLARIGDEFQAEVLGYGRAGLVLSRKKCTPDPLKEFQRKHRPGETVQGRLKLLSPNHAGIKLEIGSGETAIDGFVPASELPPSALSQDGFGLLVGDHLAGRILRFDRDSVVLSVRDQLRARDAWIASSGDVEPATLQHNPKLGPTLERLYYKQRLAEAPGLTASDRVREEIHRILLVEDEDSVANSLRDALEHAGFEVETASTSRAARETLRTKSFDLLVLDRNLQGAEGTELLQDPSVLVAFRLVCILTGTPSQEVFDAYADLAAERRLLVLEKPTPPEALFEQLDRLLENEGSLEARAQPSLETSIPAPDSEFQIWRPRQFGRQEQLEELMIELRTLCDADYAFLLAYEEGPVFRRVAGNFVELTREMQQHLEVSAVGNVITRREHAFDASLEGTAASHHQHLLEVIRVTSFQGFGLSYSDRARYGTFLLNDKPRPLKPLSEAERRLWELRITQHLVEARFATALVDNQTMLLKGLLTSALLHEVGNRLQTLTDHSALLVETVKSVTDGKGGIDQDQALELMKSTAGISAASKNLDDLVRTFRNLFGAEGSERVLLDQLLQNLERTFRSVAHRDGVNLKVDLVGKTPAVNLNPKFLEQPILNLLLNAKEQMVLSGSHTRRIWLTAEASQGARYPIKISVRDTGPGIHARDSDRVFDLFFTTKPKGTGLGLFIARLLVERFGGRICLESSTLFEGTTFTLELPESVIA